MSPVLACSLYIHQFPDHCHSLALSPRLHTCISIFFLAHSAKRSRFISHHFTGRKRTTTTTTTKSGEKEISSFVDPTNEEEEEEETANSIDEAKTRPPRGGNEQEIIPLFYPILGHDLSLLPFLRPRRRRRQWRDPTPRLQQRAIHLDSSSFFSPLSFFTRKKKKEKKVKSPGGKFLLLFSKVFPSFFPL